ncbi:MAG: carboxypeptidase M32 [Cellvibrionaceae bacterium]
MANHYYQRLVERFRRIHNVNHSLTFLSWDQSVMMPQNGNSARSNAMAELSTLAHELLTAPAVADWIEEAANEALNSTEKVSLSKMKRSWQQASCLPSDFVQAQTLAGSQCEYAWRQQRVDNDWTGFLKNFKPVLKLSKEEAGLRQEANPTAFTTPYDALLDLYCHGDSNTFIADVFERLRSDLPPLIQQVMAVQRNRPKKNVNGHFDIDSQHELNKEAARILGFNFDAGRLDISTHPFSTGVRGDHRICTRYNENEFLQALLATAHETGHASYEAGLPEEWDGLPVGSSLSMCIHESQSLLFEKQLFIAKPFTRFLINKAHQYLPATKDYSAEQLWHEYTRVEPSYIRVDADEVTYPMHIVLRYEIESALINGAIDATDIPDMWNDKMSQYLGLETKNNFKDGCLQDIHWTYGAFGYFPSYTIGALNAAQLFATIKSIEPDWQELLSKGDVSFIREWLRENIWQHGSFFSSQDLIEKASGEHTNPEFFLQHIKDRYLKESY